MEFVILVLESLSDGCTSGIDSSTSSSSLASVLDACIFLTLSLKLVFVALVVVFAAVSF